ncbi:AP2/ERF and B3 domain-containing transcription factor At1g50680-like [Salvia miltiorrhiza]|uniref:AP2/ERF and B3 domain-containing transcription factor At1g50680-like n=1 Tax=Salvia miltiorrhiza TaxID=226208 RepID=UPI0025ACA5CA|nr:AP2/ERF and B3 domain-containing transcription factor At1g50680-like [Salvia miltiorrhiza]
MEEEMVSAAREVGGWRRERFKGVVPQPNGHWGAQIYANQQRIWLGTFKSETSAAIAYDSAAMKLRHGDSHTNFPPTALELGFQSQLSTEAPPLPQGADPKRRGQAQPPRHPQEVRGEAFPRRARGAAGAAGGVR